MKKASGVVMAAVILGLTAVPLSALELSMEALAGNLFFPWNQQSPTSGAFPATNLFWGGEVSVSETLGEGVSYRIGYSLDPVLRSLVSVLVTYDAGFARFSAGPFMGAFNSSDVPLKGGLSTAIRLEWPGRVFAYIRSDSSLGGGLLADGDYIQDMTEISAGWYVHNAICSLSMITKKYYSRVSDTLQTLDNLTRYTFDVNVYRKGAPLTLIWTLGYQTVSKTWDTGTASTDSLGSVILGARADWRVSRKVRITGRLETGVYTFGLENLVGNGPDQNSFLFSAGLGVIYRLGGGISGSAPAAP